MKVANDPLLFADGIDYNFIVAVRELLLGYKKENIIPTATYLIEIDR